ncbi:MAG: hypothetical protein PHP12_05695 [Bacilli bacterium]|nr:hypothetical protein [Bacilli bacterium]
MKVSEDSDCLINGHDYNEWEKHLWSETGYLLGIESFSLSKPKTTFYYIKRCNKCGNYETIYDKPKVLTK